MAYREEMTISQVPCAPPATGQAEGGPHVVHEAGATNY